MDGFGLLEPALQICRIYLRAVCVADLCGFKLSLGVEFLFIEGLSASEKEADSLLLFAVADDRVATEKSHGMSVSYLGLCIGQTRIDGMHQAIAYRFLVRREEIVICLYISERHRDHRMR
ncbi:hypothetical protein KAZ93_03850 [Patescibacteria group bacterium]|nr:hypothetical protein [Patescibacteria group bacterium]